MSDESFDAVTVAFGGGNFENLEKWLSEIYRVLKPGGQAYILEFSHPTVFPFKQLYFFYFLKVLPFLGKMFSKDNSAYTYLPESVKKFPSGSLFEKKLKDLQFKEINTKKLTLGIASIYRGTK